MKHPHSYGPSCQYICSPFPLSDINNTQKLPATVTFQHTATKSLPVSRVQNESLVQRASSKSLMCKYRSTNKLDKFNISHLQVTISVANNLIKAFKKNNTNILLGFIKIYIKFGHQNTQSNTLNDTYFISHESSVTDTQFLGTEEQ